ncbi:MAG: TetR/AcrR family transcriptional regulator [Chitinophagales bacterium]|nr:TetR/AcrR family transcriptional regulator [Chitinophagales bacterium]MDW8419291.1 TetR/AcrR family transcriptional regulator [Chitinophagales bacterium]
MASTNHIPTREKVKLTAQKLFREKGYAAVGMRELAAAAGMRAPSVYNHYRSKDHILQEICFDIAGQFFKALDEALAKEQKSSRQLRAAIRAHIDVIAANLDSAEVFFHEWIFLEQPALGKFKKMRQEYARRFREILERGIRKKEIRKVNTRLATFAIFSALNATYEFMRSDEKFSREQMADELADMLIKGLKNKD